MLGLILPNVPRPSRIDPRNDKGQLIDKNAEDEYAKEYHNQFGRYGISHGYTNQLHYDFLEKTRTNKRFYANDQWINNEDLEAFLKDDTGAQRNRIKMTRNLIRPMVEQYRGNAIRMNISARVRSMSPMATNRRDKKLADMLFYTDVAKENAEFSDYLRSKLPIGKDSGETQQIFNNIYVDEYVKRMNMLMTYVSELNKFADYQLKIAENMALAGIGVYESKENRGEQWFQVVESEDFYWDRTARKYDLTDSEFMGKCYWMLPTEIFESYPRLTDAQRNRIEGYARNMKQNIQDRNSEYMSYNGRVPVFHTYWVDCEKVEYGYVIDEFGYPFLTKINYVWPGEDAPRYTDANLIPPPNATAKRIMNGKMKTDLFFDEIRYAVNIPKEVINGGDTDENKNNDPNYSDIVCDYGLMEHQETELLDPSSTLFPFKCYCWGYIDGQVLSPVDDAIDPQRFLNRILSVAENQINNSRGSGTVYDKDMVDADGGETEMLQNMNESKPVGIRSKGRGIQNVIGSYDSTIKSGTMTLFNIMDNVKGAVQDVTGVNEPLQGQSTGNDQLVGVTNMMIQRGSLMQEPFYNAISQVFLQAYQSIATVGKRIYADNERELAIATGDVGVEVFKISKDMRGEMFRAFVKRENLDEVKKESANQLLQLFLQLGLIDKTQFANLYNRSMPEDVAAALRTKASDDIEVARKQAEQQQQMMQQQQQQQNDQMKFMMAEQDKNTAIAQGEAEKDRQNKLDNTLLKEIGRIHNTTVNNNIAANTGSPVAA